MAKEHLVSIGDRTTDEQQEICSKGGKASGEARRRKRTLQSAAQMILSLKVTDTDTIEELKKHGIDVPEDMTLREALMAVQIARAKEGDLQAAKFVRDTVGESPQWLAYRERTATMQQAHDTVTALVDDWIKSIPE